MRRCALPVHVHEIELAHGADRVMFGSDFPMWDPAHEYDTFASLGFSDGDLEKMLWKNAERFTGVRV